MKISLIISNEYRMRVFNKTFLLVTLLTPLTFLIISVLPAIFLENEHPQIDTAVTAPISSDSLADLPADLSHGVGMIMSMLIFVFIMLYGAMVMRGVVQEKINRVMELMACSVRPFDLMMGKIIGIALVGLTQFVIWIMLLLIIFAVGSYLWMSNNEVSALLSDPQINNLLTSSSFRADILGLGIAFVVYFLSGYLLYASLFAACGALVSDSEVDAQHFTLPITLIAVVAMYAGIYATSHIDSSATIFFSFFPFTSPVVMLVRLSVGVAWWEVLLSLLLLVLTFVATTWFAGRIYRFAILTYGKKITLTDIYKIVFKS